MSEAIPLVDFSAVAVRLGPTTVLTDVTMHVEPGEAIGLFGGNGSGKTTLLRTMATLQRPTAGTAYVLGVDLGGPDRLDIRGRVGMIGHTPALFPELSLRENLATVCGLSGVAPDRIDDVLDVVGLAAAADRLGRECSYGMQRRTEFARELLLMPEVLLLDEPHSALDVSAASLVEYVVSDVLGRDGGVVLVSHDRERVEKLAVRSLVLRHGTISEESA